MYLRRPPTLAHPWIGLDFAITGEGDTLAMDKHTAYLRELRGQMALGLLQGRSLLWCSLAFRILTRMGEATPGEHPEAIAFEVKDGDRRQK